MGQEPLDLPEKIAQFWKTYRVPIILGSVSILFIIISLTILIKSTQTSTPITFSSEEASVAGIMRVGEMVVDIAGAVVKPGVYTLPAGSRVEDAIAAAGGVSKEVDADRLSKVVNRAAKLSDGAKLYIPKMGDSDETSHNRIVQRDELSTSHNTLIGLNPVSVNAASQSELEALTGIGPATAKKIISGRPYRTLEELVVKKAIGQALFDKLKGQLTL
ncbi:MAG: ComEA family DNA-binding protein [Candidatus Gottesmanbacteria bacterium]|nr:ComEA family DNA-binding protein [Candidatus Gottesmanbacteria bacterium]